jgi:hypothetical protein
MHDTAKGCGCGTADCFTMPPEFVRVRYYFGQRMGVMELSDQAGYHSGKHAFHNARCHGVGVLCGLKAERFAATAGAKTTILRVTSGAALDACGREVIVGTDQCIDVAAWFSKNKAKPELAGWTAGTTQTLIVAVRYRECPSDPSPAPRDPCGCDTSGCEYGRVREGFELALFTDSEKICADVSFPETAALLSAIDGRADAGAIGQAIDALVAADCPAPSDETWLCLASFTVTLDAAPVPIDISDPDNAIPARRSLLSTSALQSILLDLSSAGAGSGLVGTGPQLGVLAFTASAPDGGTLTLPVTLAQGGSPLAPVPIETTTFDPATVKLKRLVVGTGWKDVTPPVASITYNPGPPQRFEISIASGLMTGSPPIPYLLTFDPSFDAPIADTLGRSLRPRRLSRLFAFVPDGPNLKLGSL